MIRKAIVIVPSDEDYKARIEAQEKEETKDVPDNAVMEMKGIAKDKLTFFVVALINLELLRNFYNLASISFYSYLSHQTIINQYQIEMRQVRIV